MCRWRQIQDTYTKCDHIYRHPDEMVYCPGPNCRFSPNHPSDCPDCPATCWQFRRFPEQIDRHLNKLCPNCQRKADQQ